MMVLLWVVKKLEGKFWQYKFVWNNFERAKRGLSEAKVSLKDEANKKPELTKSQSGSSGIHDVD